jgi:hypothetical protein
MAEAHQARTLIRADESEKQIGDHCANASCPDVKSENASGRYIFRKVDVVLNRREDRQQDTGHDAKSRSKKSQLIASGSQSSNPDHHRNVVIPSPEKTKSSTPCVIFVTGFLAIMLVSVPDKPCNSPFIFILVVLTIEVLRNCHHIR